MCIVSKHFVNYFLKESNKLKDKARVTDKQHTDYGILRTFSNSVLGPLRVCKGLGKDVYNLRKSPKSSRLQSYS